MVMNARTKYLTRKILSSVFIGAVLLLLYLPIIWMIVFSFTDTTSISKWSGFSFEAYISLFAGEKSGEIGNALVNTLIIALAASAISTVLGTFGAIGMHSMRRKKLKAMYSNTSNIPIANADIVTAISLMLLFTSLKTLLRLPSEVDFFVVILAHTTFCTPYVMLNVLPRLKQMDNNLYEAALDLGAKPRQALFKIILPEILPGIIMGFILAFTLSIDDFVITKFNITNFNTLSTYIYSSARGKKPLPIEIRALSSLIFLVILGILIGINAKSMKNRKKVLEKAKGKS